MRLPLLELQLMAGAQSRRQENGSGETSYSEEGVSGNQTDAGLTIVLPLVARFCAFVLLFCFLIFGMKLWRGNSVTTSAGEASIQRMRRQAAKKSLVVSVQLLGSLPIAKFEAISQKVGLAENLSDLTKWTDTGLQTIGTGAAANRIQDNTSRMDVNSQIPQSIELGPVESSVISNSAILLSEPCDIATYLANVKCTICEEDFPGGARCASLAVQTRLSPRLH